MHKHVYKILDQGTAEPLQGKLPLSELDKKSGYMHLCTAEQLSDTLDCFFARHHAIRILKIRISDLAGKLVYEGSGQDKFPHLYDSIDGIHSGIVKDTFDVKREEGSSWHDTLSRLTGLED